MHSRRGDLHHAWIATIEKEEAGVQFVSPTNTRSSSYSATNTDKGESASWPGRVRVLRAGY